MREYNEATVSHNTIKTILERNKVVENEMIQKTSSQLLQGSEITAYYCLSVAKLKDFIHVREFTGKTFLDSKLVVNGGENSTILCILGPNG